MTKDPLCACCGRETPDHLLVPGPLAGELICPECRWPEEGPDEDDDGEDDGDVA